MAISIKKVVDELREELSGYRMSDDSVLPDYEYFVDKINSYRVSVIRELEVIPESSYTTSCCYEIKCVGQSCTLNGITYKSKRKLYEVDVENLVDGVGDKDIIYFGLDGFAYDFTRVTLQEFGRTGYAEYGNEMPIYARVGNKIIVKNIPDDGLLFVCITALLLSPTSDCGYTDNTPYPASDDVLNRVKRLVKMDVLHALGIQPDLINDALPAIGRAPEAADEPEE